ncbi:MULTISPECIES: NADP-dependent oxidoreductase [Pseudomonas]|uniref:NADP-dependent oxidoreductase n=1 Tax=Pseudomonas abyssi TaxID=170540 RepID=A0A2A3MG47_9PSED|nr:NADP-dependent oxidoreductase [Pseudomonas abyssi]MAD01831.1 NADP-dependent oxidoreductase [Pseudomonadales bacterium]PBK03789.1 NADP-dependent oxidoreductase [Pseudomonas abyssi]|tara:strand:+ start:33139 stop:34161 length:1023 start_codon:yes stop_codon:yes gene_type:complete
MSAYSNRKVVLNKRPQGEIQDGDLVLKEETVRDLKDGEVLIKTLWLSLDPYMRPRMNDSKGYMDPIEIGAPIVGESVGRVVESKSDNYQVGDVVTVYSGWQEYCIIPGNAEMVYKIKDQGVPLQTYLGVAGMPGRTGYCGLMYVGKPKSGETVVVAAASGPVGTVVGQTAKQEGCRVVGIAGGPEKCRYVVEELGFDACIDYKAGNLDADLAAACPNGIDVYFENVGGEVAKAVAKLINPGARVPICGYVSAYNAEDQSKVETPFHIFGALDPKPEHRFFLVTEWQDKHQEITALLAEQVASGKLKYSETVAEGLENAVEAFKGMLKGKNFGKQLVHIAD